MQCLNTHLRKNLRVLALLSSTAGSRPSSLALSSSLLMLFTTIKEGSGLLGPAAVSDISIYSLHCCFETAARRCGVGCRVNQPAHDHSQAAFT